MIIHKYLTPASSAVRTAQTVVVHGKSCRSVCGCRWSNVNTSNRKR